MEKIIQIEVTEEEMFALTSDGKIYARIRKITKKVKAGIGQYRQKGYYYWKEVPEREDF